VSHEHVHPAFASILQAMVPTATGDSGGQAQPTKPAPYKAELNLEPTRALPRRLNIQLLSSGKTLWVHLASRSFAPLSSGHCLLQDCYLSLSDNAALCLREADFRVTAAEAVKIRALFEPLGLRIWKSDK
jgi:hypothetical protein